MELIIVGCGYLGHRLAGLVRSRNWSVAATVRSPEAAAKLVRQGIEATAVDLDRPVAAGALPMAGGTVLYLAPPPATGTADPRLARFCVAARGGLPARVIYLSTTGVYGDCQGALVTNPGRRDPRPTGPADGWPRKPSCAVGAREPAWRWWCCGWPGSTAPVACLWPR